ncbi:saccharopine dehydrogenase NADP-binding domain-containing protein [Spirosoma sp.]|uniref:saccharopine dehydrogenase family protein n=1 Tax=Spirosoma sp. TaxID=1899569 RepID=UPI0026167F7B|nr:saccharopine dehydrogenase NADP-binding domain-containing protein [Spirosoma sp.]MCX6216059.1 saccharopine dehydrogenase NADP-binding domain-containing protein [Spirosoma sp.]
MAESSMFDVVVFGATSFVGQIITHYLFDECGVGRSVKWAIAGRSESKLLALRDSLGDMAHHLPVIVADAQSEETLKSLCTRTRVVISTVGPYALSGEPLVKACTETGTDCCDLTGEVHWVKRMIDRYEPLAKQSGARIVHCCGYDSIPSDMGVYYLQQQAKGHFGTACSTVTMRVKAVKGGASGGTIASVLNLVKEASTDAALRKELANPYSICPPVDYKRPKQTPILSVKYDEDANAWMAPFVMAAVNEQVVQRSNAFLHYHPNFTYNEAMLTGKGVVGLLASTVVTAGIGGFMLAVAARPLRGLIGRFLPKPGEGPSPEAQRTGFFVHDVYGKTDIGRTIHVRVSGDRDPGYGSTAKMIAQAGLCLAQDIAKTAKPGGFYTPAAGFGHQLLNRLQAHSGLSFTVVATD